MIPQEHRANPAVGLTLQFSFLFISALLEGPRSVLSIASRGGQAKATPC